MVIDDPVVPADALEAATGWVLKPQGLCRGDVCVPLPADARTDDGRVDLRVVAARAGFALVHDEGLGLWALGPAAGPTLVDDELPDLVLTDLEGRPAPLVDAMGPDKGVLIAFASW